MPVLGSELVTPETVAESFLASPPLIQQTINDLTVQHPVFLRDIWDLQAWPTGAGTEMQHLNFRGAMPPIERGFDQWKKLGNSTGCEPGPLPNCGYNYTTFGGHAFDRKVTNLMTRDFRTPDYCIWEIQTTYMFKEVMEQIVKNLYRQTDFFKEQNIGLNGLASLSKKFVVDAAGAKYNRENPYVYRNTGDVRLSTLNLEMLEFFYEHMRRLPDALPFDVVNGAPLYAIVASQQLFSRMYRDNAGLREDVRFSSRADDLLNKYNFMSTIRGMFIVAPILYPRRFNIVAGEPMEVLPFINGIPAEFGEYTDLNPDYESATHEEVIMFGQKPFKIFTFESETSAGGGTSFGPEQSFMNNWDWFNPQTPQDPRRRVGFFMTSATFGLSQQYSEGMYAILVERPSVALMAQYTPNPVCPVTPPVCTNIVPDVGCPCPMVLSIMDNPLDSAQQYFTFNLAVEGAVDEDVRLLLDNGAYITGTLVDVSTDGKTALFEFTTPLTAATKAQIIGVFCDETLGCAARVDNANDCRSGVTDTVRLTLSNPIVAITAGDEILAYFKDCTTALLEVVSVDLATMEWTVQYAAGYGPTDNPDGSGTPPTNDPLTAGIICDRGGISKVCVPPSTDATCPACEVSLAACEED